MNIDAIDIRRYRLPLDPPFRASWDPRPRASFTSTIVRIRSGDLEGVGSGDDMLGFAGHEDLFLGHDVFDIERHVAVLDNLQFHYGRMWPLEIALWDLAGKIRGQPLWRMLADGARALEESPGRPSPAPTVVPGRVVAEGAQTPSPAPTGMPGRVAAEGARAPSPAPTGMPGRMAAEGARALEESPGRPSPAQGRVRVYASTGERLPADERAASAVRLRDAGFPAIKLRFHADDPADDIAVVTAVRDAVGSDIEILVDANQGWRMPWDTSPSWDIDTARNVADQLGDLGVYWLEEPLHRHDYANLRQLRLWSPVKIAGGEGNREPADFDQYLIHRALDVYQPDVAWTTGVIRATRLAQRVRDAGAMYTPHTWGDGLVLLANLHVAVACSNAPFVEYPFDPPSWTPDRRDFILPAPIVADNGWVALPDAPGLGVTMDWRALEPFRVA